MMKQMEFIYFPFEGGDEDDQVEPLFDEEEVRKLGGKHDCFSLTIHGPASILKISQVASLMESLLGLDYLDWEFTESTSSNKELVAVLHLNQSFVQPRRNLENVLKEANPYFDYWLTKIVEHGLPSAGFINAIELYGMRQKGLSKLLSLLEPGIFLTGEEEIELARTQALLLKEIFYIDGRLRSILFAMLEDNDFHSVRQTGMLLELTFLFTLFLTGCEDKDFNEFERKAAFFLKTRNEDHKIVIGS